MAMRQSEKPVIALLAVAHPGCSAKLRELRAGMEEEGVPCLLVEVAGGDAAQMAYDGACGSQLGVGIGVSETAICIHYRKLPPEQPLFVCRGGDAAEWRRCGYNAARLVKGLPFKDKAAARPAKADADVYQAVRELVLRIMREAEDVRR
ncbi:MAG: glycerol dehydratase reactivase beta/small subunit family protein [Sporomusaceae bacterium]|nr:glycerol dehydratase reactivase beta/small subunit family protein [Sporomusaceae bacterium]